MDPVQQDGESKLMDVRISKSSGPEDFVAIVPDGSTKEKTEVDIVAVPAIGADPERTWVPYLMQHSAEPLGRTNPLFLDSSPAVSTKTLGPTRLSSRKTQKKSLEEYIDTPQDIEQDGRDTSHGPWLTNDLRQRIPQARVLLYDHGTLSEGDTLQRLALRFLEALRKKHGAQSDSPESSTSPRPVFLICHSTGGLVAKQALILANEKKKFTTLAHYIYGITFIATPHQGSTYLSSKEFRPSIREVMQLRSDIPESLERQLCIGSGELRNMAEKFQRFSTDLRINTYYETIDSDLAFIPANSDIPRSYHVPIASVASAILDLEHEFEAPLSSDHMGCATFEGDDEAQETFTVELESAVRLATALSKMKHNKVNLEEEVNIEVNGFFEDSISSVKFWTARPSLADFFRHGPTTLLEGRLKQSREPAKVSTAKKEVLKLTKQDSPVSPRKPEERESRLQETRRPSNTNNQLLLPRNSLARSFSDGQSASALDRALHDKIDSGIVKDAQAEAPASMSNDSLAASPGLPKQVQPKLDRRKSTAPADPGPQLPAMDRLKLTWVHIPYTHSGWVPHVLDRCSKDKGSVQDFLKEEHWASNHNRGRHAAPHAKFVNSAFIDPSPAGDAESQRNPTRFATYFQYLHWDTYRRLVERRNLIKRRMRQGRVRPVHQDIKNSSSLEDKMIWRYLGAEPPFHCRRTLDQYGYPDLHSTEARDDDQMLWKRTRPKTSAKKTRLATQGGYDHEFAEDTLVGSYHTSTRQGENTDEALQTTLRIISQPPEVDVQEGNVLMVDQLWLWVLDARTIVTFFPRKEAISSEGKLYQQGDLHNDIYNEINSDLQSIPDAQTFTALVVRRAVTVLMDRTSHRHLQVLRIYEESLSILIERMTKSYKTFRREGFSARPEERETAVEKQSKEDFSSLLELRDIHDELHTIKKLFKEQRETLLAMVNYYIRRGPSKMQITTEDLTASIQQMHQVFKAQGHDDNGLQHLGETAQRLDFFEVTVSEMIESAEKTEKAYSNLLDIKQKQANVDESRLARSQMDATATQGRSIMIFTIITIIFLPLSFFTSLFGMNVREWMGNNQPPPLHQVALFIGPISVAVIFATLTLAFSTHIRSCAVITQKITVGVLHDLYHIATIPIVAACIPSLAAYRASRLPAIREWIADRYLRSPDQGYGKDHNVWDEYALPLHKSPRDVASQEDRVPSSRHRSFFDRITGEKSW